MSDYRTTPIPTETIHTKVAGTSFRNPNWADILCGDRLRLQREPENEYDQNAIAIYHKNDHIGYINRKLAEELAPVIDNALALVECHVVSITGYGAKNMGCNIRLDIQYPQAYLESLSNKLNTNN